MLVQRFFGPVAPHPHVEADVAARIERAGHLLRLFGQRGEQGFVDLKIGAAGLEPARRIRRKRAGNGGRQSHRLPAAVRRQVDLQRIVFQHDRPAAMIEPVREFVMREGNVQTSHRNLRLPGLAVVFETHVGVDRAGGGIVLPPFLHRRRQHAHQRGIQIQTANLGRQRQRAGRLEARAAARRCSVACPLRAVRSSIA